MKFQNPKYYHRGCGIPSRIRYIRNYKASPSEKFGRGVTDARYTKKTMTDARYTKKTMTLCADEKKGKGQPATDFFKSVHSPKKRTVWRPGVDGKKKETRIHTRHHVRMKNKLAGCDFCWQCFLIHVHRRMRFAARLRLQ